jgi:hypothetical protein
VAAIHRPAAIDQGRGEHRFNSEGFDASAGGHDVSDGVKGAHFVKSDVLGWNVVDLRFGNSNTPEYSDTPFLDEIAKVTCFDQAANLKKAAPVCV